MSRPLRVLYYNWVDYLDAAHRGGGVSVYQTNLMRAWAESTQLNACFLSAGTAHDLPARAPRWEPQRHGGQEARAQRFELVNSGVLAPGHAAFGDPAQLTHGPTEEVFFDFIEKTGPYDVVHFNNLEGLPLSVLALKERWPQTKVILSLHNYYPLCPQVNLWQNERSSCDNYKDGQACVSCLEHPPNRRMLRLSAGLSYRLQLLRLRPGSWGYEMVFGGAQRGARALVQLMRWRAPPHPQIPTKTAAKTPARPAGAAFAARRAAMVAAINSHCDRVLCVSDAVRILAERHGIAPALTHSCYIGTREAEAFAQTTPRGALPGADGTLKLAYLGYMRRDKGFFFLLEVLENLPAELAARLHLLVAARKERPETMQRLEALGQRLGGLHYHDGYSHDALDDLLGDVDVGVVPVLWHDNLPQVAIEMHARHIPLLCANMGGAQELGRCAQMVFTAGDKAGLTARIAALLAGEVDMDAYWQGAMPPTTMAGHVAALMRHYRA